LVNRILFLVKSTSPFKTQRNDLDYLISELIKKGHNVEIYDMKQKILMDVKNEIQESYELFPSWLYKGKLSLLLNFFVFIHFLKRKSGCYSIVQICYVREEFLLLPNLIKRLADRVYILVFGSDYNLRNPIKDHFTKLYSLADKVFVTTGDAEKRMKGIINEPSLDKKTFVLMTPQNHFELYDGVAYEEKTHYKNLFGFDENKKVILVGTNSSPNEQHELAIESLKFLDPSRYILVFSITNVFDEITEREQSLANHIRSELEGFELIILHGFLKYEEVRDLRFASDFFINVRKNDQMALSMIESNLAYNYVVTGEWLPYKCYSEDFKVIRVSEVAKIFEVIDSVSNMDENELSYILVQNRQQALDMYGKGLIDSWLLHYA